MDEGHTNPYAYLLKDLIPSNSFLNQEAEQEVQKMPWQQSHLESSKRVTNEIHIHHTHRALGYHVLRDTPESFLASLFQPTHHAQKPPHDIINTKTTESVVPSHRTSTSTPFFFPVKYLLTSTQNEQYFICSFSVGKGEWWVLFYNYSRAII